MGAEVLTTAPITKLRAVGGTGLVHRGAASTDVVAGPIPRGVRDDNGDMLHTATESWRDSLILSREVETAGARRELFARVRRGELVALYRGVYIAQAQWCTMDSDSQYRARVKAAAAFAGTDVVFSHQSAAALWRLPLVGRWPTKSHTVVDVAGGGRSNAMFARHAVGVPSGLDRIDGLALTGLGRTVVDLARVLPFGPAVALADAALRRTDHPVDGLPRTLLSHAELREELEAVPLRLGSAKAATVIDFADGAANRPGESMSRANMHLARLTMPQLQVKLCGASGKEYEGRLLVAGVQCHWGVRRQAQVHRPRVHGRTIAEQVLYDEKLREDDLRAANFGFTRWPWATAISVPLLRAHLVAAGIR